MGPSSDPRLLTSEEIGRILHAAVDAELYNHGRRSLIMSGIDVALSQSIDDFPAGRDRMWSDLLSLNKFVPPEGPFTEHPLVIWLDNACMSSKPKYPEQAKVFAGFLPLVRERLKARRKGQATTESLGIIPDDPVIDPGDPIEADDVPSPDSPDASRQPDAPERAEPTTREGVPRPPPVEPPEPPPMSGVDSALPRDPVVLADYAGHTDGRDPMRVLAAVLISAMILIGTVLLVAAR